jgi:hypothetical protein
MPRAPGDRLLFPPLQLAQIKAVACEVPFRLNLPFSRLSLSELQGYVKEQQIVEHISIGALWNLLNQDAIRPWYHRSWIFPRDPQFIEKAAPELDLYQGQWEERCLRAGEHVVCLDMKSSIQARARCHGSVPPHPGHGQLVEHKYERQGALNLIACLDVHSGQVFGRCYDQRGNQAVRDFLGRAFAREPYASARRIHLVLDNGTSQHPSTFPPWLAQHHDKVPVHYLPVHASWLNQIEIYFSIVQRQGVNTQRLR